jgi:hypothetical protein
MVKPALALLAVVLLAGCGGGGTSSDEPANGPAKAGAVLEGDTVEGGSLSLADFRGKPVFVNVWASW